MANADTVSDQMLHAGFEDISLRRCDLPIMGGRDVDEAIDLVMSIGPAGEILRLRATAPRTCMPRSTPRCARACPSTSATDGVVWAPASTWIVTATAPEGS